MLYSSFKEAHTYLNLGGNPELYINGDAVMGITCLHVIDSDASYNEISNDGRVVKFVGFGLQTVPGHPGTNQQWARQEPFFVSWKQGLYVPILRKNKYGNVKFLGNYKIKDVVKKMGFEGFTYFHIILHRKDLSPLNCYTLDYYKTAHWNTKTKENKNILDSAIREAIASMDS
jgi:hypothetical protein